MSKADILLALLLVLGAVLGYRRGFLMELIMLGAIMLGVLLGLRLMKAGATYLHREFNADTKLLPYISFALIFLLVIMAVIFLGRRIKALVDKTFLGRVDAIAGAVIGGVKYMFCASVLIWLISAFHYSFPPQWTDHSWLYPYTEKFAYKVAYGAGEILPFFKGIFKEI